MNLICTRHIGGWTLELGHCINSLCVITCIRLCGWNCKSSIGWLDIVEAVDIDLLCSCYASLM
jgi:hypothetical protein